MIDEHEISPDDAPPQRRSRVALVTTGFLLALLAAVTFIAWREWTNLSDTSISQQGLLALGVGAAAAFIVGGGLMVLVFISSRRGYDDEAGHD